VFLGLYLRAAAPRACLLYSEVAAQRGSPFTFFRAGVGFRAFCFCALLSMGRRDRFRLSSTAFELAVLSVPLLPRVRWREAHLIQDEGMVAKSLKGLQLAAGTLWSRRCMNMIYRFGGFTVLVSVLGTSQI
jgi:hypothetical protein